MIQINTTAVDPCNRIASDKETIGLARNQNNNDRKASNDTLVHMVQPAHNHN